MVRELAVRAGFTHPQKATRSMTQRAVALQLLATLVLTVSLVIAATVVSMGIARADTLGRIADNEATFAVALFFGLVMIGMGGLTAVMASERN